MIDHKMSHVSQLYSKLNFTCRFLDSAIGPTFVAAKAAKTSTMMTAMLAAMVAPVSTGWRP